MCAYVCGLQIFDSFCTIESFYHGFILYNSSSFSSQQMKNTFDFDSTDDEEKKLLIDLIIFSSSCFQNVQSLGVGIARPRKR